MKKDNYLNIFGAKHHNLKNLNLKIPRDKLIIVCGPSGSGKSTLAFDIIYAEGQRRYVESLSAYARQFLPQLDKPKVDKITGLSPAISIEQHAITKNPRSTVGTMTEIHDFLRVFFARLGTIYCPICNNPVKSQTADQIVDKILNLKNKTKFIILSPLIKNKKGTQKEILSQIKKNGFSKVRVDKIIYNIDEVPPLAKTKKHYVDIVVDRLIVKSGIQSRVTDSVELALSFGEGTLIVLADEKEVLYNTRAVCTEHNFSVPNLTPQLFSFNSPIGFCNRCYGLGAVSFYDPMLIAPDRKLSISSGALTPFNTRLHQIFKKGMEKIGKKYDFTLNTPLNKVSEEGLDALFHGESSWSGIIDILKRGEKYGKTFYDKLAKFKRTISCPACEGARLNEKALSVKVGNLNIYEFSKLPVNKSLLWVLSQTFEGDKHKIAEPLIKELNHRLKFLKNVGLDYLSLDRKMSTLSGGEAQRIRLASQLGTGLVGVTYVLDEPSIGLHQKDNQRLINTLRELQQRGNTVIVVEHDEQTILHGDHIIELGPGSGRLGGEIVFTGTPKQLLKNSNSLTARYLTKKEKLPRPEVYRKPDKFITLKGVTTNNLKNITCKFPLGTLTCVTGVSGSGKSSLVVDTLYKNIAYKKGLKTENMGKVVSMSNIELIDKLVIIDQSPIGRTPRSNPATYTKIFDDIRDLFTLTLQSKTRGYKKGRFSFNVKGGRCEACRGDGQIRVEMHFLSDVFITCDLCKGKRYNRETLEVKYKGKNISEVLHMTVREAFSFFENHPSLNRKLSVLMDVGLEYIELGQPATTLSGGEAQRIKISRELGKKKLPRTLYILDEPTTGLHMYEVGKLIDVLNQLVEKEATIILIEHNLDVVASCDHIIDLGFGGGEDGGKIVASGNPHEISENKNSITGFYLKEILDNG
jgi:excinuclease ABC subunit A